MKIQLHYTLILLSLLFSVKVTAQMKKNELFKNDWVVPCKIFKKEFPLYILGSGGLSFGPEHMLGFPIFNIAIQSHYNKGVYLGVQVGTALGFAYSHGVHAGLGYKWLTLDYAQSKFISDGRNHFTHNIKGGINLGICWIKFGPSIINNDFSSVDRTFINNKKYQFNIELLFSNRMLRD
jgi:hypothetical protein